MQKLPQFSVSNPLGIIALFISLIYGIAALLLGFSVPHLQPTNQTALVWFVIAFPVAVLGTFAWLVTRHHTKLYGPSDFRSDEAFTVHAGPRLEVGLRIEEDLAEDEPAPHEAAAEPSAPSSIRDRKAEIFLIQELVLKELHRRMGGNLHREVRADPSLVNSPVVDAVIETPKTAYFIEVKVAPNRPSASKRVKESIAQLAHYRHVLLTSGSDLGGAQFVIALAVQGEFETADIEAKYAPDLRAGGVSIELFSVDALLRDYGFAT